uniref:Putative methyltransferase n=1 Tax=viral metagenome TaxID=1070528 RepID=A0A6M3IQC3_9ZZZZ
MKVRKIRLDDINIRPDRQRKFIDDTYLDELSESMRLTGLIHPIVVEEGEKDELFLVSGECRLRAARLLGWKEIDASLREDLDQWEREVIELEENLRRKALTPAEEVLAKERLDKVYREKYGSAEFGSNKGGWGIENTARLLGISAGTASTDLQLARALKNNPEMAKLKTKAQMKSEYKRQQAIKSRQLLVLLKGKQDERHDLDVKDTNAQETETYMPDTTRPVIILKTDTRDSITHVRDESIHCLITDPPWQVEHDAIAGTDPSTGLELTKQVLLLLKPKLVDGALCWLFCATKHLIKGTIYKLVLECGYNVFEQIFIWYKPHIAHSSHPYGEIKNDYEPALFFSNGKPRDLMYPIFAINEGKVLGRKIHPEQKPLEIMEKLIDVSTVEGETVIDPFCGSGQVGVAAKKLNRRAILFERQQHWYDVALSNLMEVDK